MNNVKKVYSKLLKEKKKLNNALFGDTDYKKFVIISRSRTGSTLLMTMLNDHTNIICDGEIFKELDGKSCEQIWGEFYAKKPKQIKYVGFKLFYYHPFADDKGVWDFIDNDKDIHIIHLTRKNYLEAYVSQKIGEKTKKWTENELRPLDIKLEEKRIILNGDECEATFTKIKNYESETVERFKNHKFIEVDYKDLNEDKYGAIKRVLQSFELPFEKHEVVNKKQNTEDLQDLVENYAELKERFSSTEWGYLFE